MARKSSKKKMKMPKCRACERAWRPAAGVVASSAYCPKCARERRKMAAAHFGWKPITAVDLIGPYLLPARLRAA